MKERIANLMRGPSAWVLGIIAAVTPIVIGRWIYRVAADVPHGVTEDGVMLACAGVVVLTTAFVALLTGARLMLRRGGGTAGVARTVLDEAAHMKIAVVFIVLLMVLVPTLPFLMDSSDPLRYRVQGFLSYSMTVMMVLLSLLTIFLACWTLSGEIEQKQIFTIATKPIGRGRYLLGKWIGIVILNGMLLAVASLGIWGYTTQYLAQQPPTEEHDAAALQEEVLTARVAAPAQPDQPVEQVAAQRLEQIRENDPQTIRRAGQAEAERMGLANAGSDMVMELGERAVRHQLLERAEQQWRSVPPMQATTFKFDGLENAHLYSDFVQFRYHARISEEVPDGRLGVIIEINGQRTGMDVVVGQTQVVPLPVDLIEDGEINMIIYNRSPRNPQGRREITLVFDGAEGLEMLYRVGPFTPNFVRGMLANWVKLGFLAMLGLLAATFLGFPVASLFSLLIFLAATTSPFLLEALQMYGGGQGVAGVMREGLSGFGTMVAGALRSFAHYSPGPLIVDGRHFGWSSVARCFFSLGLVWTGGAGLVAVLIFRARELARVQV